MTGKKTKPVATAKISKDINSSNKEGDVAKKQLNSYTIRSRNSTAKHKFISTHGGGLVVNYQTGTTNWLKRLGNITIAGIVQDKADLDDPGKLVVEIGFGGGDVLVSQALSRPLDLFIGIEVYPTGIARVLKKIKDNNMTNVSLIQHDALEALRDMFEDDILDEIRVLFPDPWPKKKHHKRRLLKEDFVRTMVAKLKKGGVMHLATDWQEYAEEIMDVLTTIEKDKLIKNLFEGYADGRQMSRPITKFEQKGLNEGRQIYEFLFVKL
ncbi:MAG: tRNA (guanosine(46)-N7)-methyltransferase TrmB [Candidatus Portiera sp.]|nr:tRNA (guanosine(46)-N7)-methyltransferase TrmB [Portiera sp.]